MLGLFLSYVVTEGNQRSLYLANPLVTNSAVRVSGTPFESGVVVDSISWSPDSTFIAFTAEVAGPAGEVHYGAFSYPVAGLSCVLPRLIFLLFFSGPSEVRLDDDAGYAFPTNSLFKTYVTADSQRVIMVGNLEGIPVANRTYLYAALPNVQNSTYRFDDMGNAGFINRVLMIPSSSNVTWNRDGVLVFADSSVNATDENVVFTTPGVVQESILSVNGSFVIFSASLTPDVSKQNVYYLPIPEGGEPLPILYPGQVSWYLEYMTVVDQDQFIFNFNDGATTGSKSYPVYGTFYGTLTPPQHNSDNVAVMMKQPEGTGFVYRTYMANEFKVTCL